MANIHGKQYRACVSLGQKKKSILNFLKIETDVNFYLNGLG